MTTHKKLTPEALRALEAKSAIAFNKHILDDIIAFVFNKITDIDTLIMVYDALDVFVENLDINISKTLKSDETNNTENS